ncbi:MAG: hypothetical protein KBS69_01195 [Bacteroidales bacterium]|nr:hypothetical protein [Candidatus Colicola caccequi]
MDDCRFIRDYLSTLREDSELDYIFPILLSAMNFQVLSTPKNSKGQSQYGKDVVAIGICPEDGIKYCWCFELKGGDAKNINNNNFLIQDGIRESLLEAKDLDFQDFCIPNLDKLPRKYVIVHNGVIKEDTRRLFDSFARKEFNSGELERWDIDKLTSLFSSYLFNESLLADEQCYLLLKRILVLLDSPGWETRDVDSLTNLLLKKCASPIRHSKRVFQNVMSSLNLVLCLIYKYCEECENYLPAKNSSDRVILLTWKWILQNHLENSKEVELLFGNLVYTQSYIYNLYFSKTLPLAVKFKGLYIPRGGEVEQICYPLRCYDYMNSLIYFYIMCDYFLPRSRIIISEKDQMATIISILEHNSGFEMALEDSASVGILFILWFVNTNKRTEKMEEIIVHWLQKIVINMVYTHHDKGLFPELRGSRNAIAESLYQKSVNYVDSSSLLILILFEIIAWLGDDNLYKMLYEEVKNADVNLQIAYPIDSESLEANMYDHRLDEELSVEIGVNLPPTLQEFSQTFVKHYDHIPLVTEKTKFWFVDFLAHIHYRTDWFPDFINFGFLRPMK